MAHDVFISYSTKDKAIADKICASLESKRIRCWIAPRDVLPGKTYAGAIAEAISNSKVLVLVFTENANNSNQVLKEVEVAFRNDVIVIPFKTEDFKPNFDLEYYLSNIHWLDLKIPNIDEQIEKLIEKTEATLSVYKPADVRDNPLNRSQAMVQSQIKTDKFENKPENVISEVSLPQIERIENENSTINVSHLDEKLNVDNIEFNSEESEEVRNLKKAYEKGSVDAAFQIGELYYIGQGVKKDLKKAKEYYTKAAEADHENAQLKLGLILCNKELSKMKKATKAGLAAAGVLLGPISLLAAGGVVLNNYIKGSEEKKEGIKWLKMAAGQGNATAQELLEQIMKNESNVSEDSRN